MYDYNQNNAYYIPNHEPYDVEFGEFFIVAVF
jgi:hypothetical protein